MAVTQYIGARYVPKFFENSDGTEEWRAGVEYEPFTIVTYNNNSYTSKKPVPSNIGNPSDNPSYWVSTGVYNAYVEQLRQDVIQYKAETSEDIAELDNKIDNLGARKVLFISDSYCDTNRGGYANGIFTRFCNYAGLTPGTDAFLSAKGGAGFAGAGQGKTFSDLLTDWYNANRTKAESITDIFVAGGANDTAETAAAINTGKAAFIALCGQYIPGAKIHIAMCSGFLQASSRRPLMATVRTVYYTASQSNVIFVLNAHLPMMRVGMFYDTVHPNASGCTAIGFQLANHLLTGDTFADFGNAFKQNVYCTAPSSGSSSTLYTRMNYNKNGYDVYIPANGETISLRANVEVAHNTGATIPVGFLQYGSNSEMLCANCENVTDGEPIYRIPCIIEGYTGTEPIAWLPLVGELIGVCDNSNNTTWYFRCQTAIHSATISQARWTPFMAHIF